MNIHGIGTDIVNIKRIKDAINKNKNFKKRIFTSFEIKACEKRVNKINCFAKRFAAKEAFAKSLGTGFREGINFRDISIKNNTSGKPSIYISKKIKQLIKKKFKISNFRIFLSLSDEDKYSIAFVIIEKTK